jgi:hypothetical protein
MSDSSLYEETKLLAKLTVLEHVVGMMVQEAILRTGKGCRTFSTMARL